jgi:NAD(P)-dependent dehydrogenase (short-subunit alcohol dehydrogenase family)
MPGTSPVILVLSARPNIGQAVAETFASKGYKIALAARSLREADSTDNQLNITSDFANPDDVVNAFTRVKKVLGIPSVVIYNGKSLPRRTLAECLQRVRSRRLDALSSQ